MPPLELQPPEHVPDLLPSPHVALVDHEHQELLWQSDSADQLPMMPVVEKLSQQTSETRISYPAGHCSSAGAELKQRAMTSSSLLMCFLFNLSGPPIPLACTLFLAAPRSAIALPCSMNQISFHSVHQMSFQRDLALCIRAFQSARKHAFSLRSHAGIRKKHRNVIWIRFSGSNRNKKRGQASLTRNTHRYSIDKRNIKDENGRGVAQLQVHVCKDTIQLTLCCCIVFLRFGKVGVDITLFLS